MTTSPSPTHAQNASISEEISPSPDLVPAFESSAGLAPPDEILVDKNALAQINSEVSENRSAVMRYSREAANVASMFAARAVRPDEIASLRRKMLNTVNKQMEVLDDVFEGKKKWGNVQARLFALLVERVMPKLTNVKIEESSAKKIEDLTMEELEAIALQKRKREAVDAVVSAGHVLEEDAEKRERREVKRAVLRELATVEAIDDAEKEYIAAQVSKPLAEVDRKERHASSIGGALTPEQEAKMKKKNGRSNVQRWMDQGMSKEEAEAKWKESVRKGKERKEKLHEAKMIRMGLTNGLGEAQTVAHNIVEKRSQTMKAFRVNPLKGVRSRTALQKQKDREEERRKKLEEKALNPRIRIGRMIAEDLPEGVDPSYVGLRDIRAARPDVLEPKPYNHLRGKKDE